MANNNDGGADMRCPDCDCFDYGDVVEHKMNTNIFGVVVGFMGSLVGIQVSPSLAVLWFQEFTLRHIDEDEYHEPPAREVEPKDNVVRMADYKLTANSKTKGAA